MLLSGPDGTGFHGTHSSTKQALCGPGLDFSKKDLVCVASYESLLCRYPPRLTEAWESPRPLVDLLGAPLTAEELSVHCVAWGSGKSWCLDLYAI